MARIDDIKKAQAKFEAAMEEYLEVVDGSPDGLMVDWFLITAYHHDHGEQGTATSVSTNAPVDQRLYQQIGLLDFAITAARSRIGS